MLSLKEIQEAKAEYEAIVAIQHKVNAQVAEKYRIYIARKKAYEKICTHKDANGLSTWESRFAYSFCTICGLDDL